MSGCGNGWLSAQYAKLGYAVTGCDVSEDGLKLAGDAFPAVSYRRASVYDDLRTLAPAGGFAAIVCSEVIEHLLDGRSAAAVFPTGGGKSLCYQLAALMLPGTALVITVNCGR